MTEPANAATVLIEDSSRGLPLVLLLYAGRIALFDHVPFMRAGRARSIMRTLISANDWGGRAAISSFAARQSAGQR